MPLIKSVSGIRGTIGGHVGDALTPIDIVALVTAYSHWLQQQPGAHTVVVGRDARPSGPIVNQLVTATLQSMGIHVIDLGLSTTPTVALAVPQKHASGGIIITASHNPATWNALKLLDRDGRLLDPQAANAVFTLATQTAAHVYAPTAQLGQYTQYEDAITAHIQQIVALPLVDVSAIRARQFCVAIDAVNSTGGIAVPQLLQALGVAQTTQLYCTPNGDFSHNPEPLPAHLTELAKIMKTQAHDIGFAVDPDVDRLAVIDEKGCAWGEDYTLVAVADYVLQHTPGSTVSNLSSSQALPALTARYAQQHFSTPVGEYHVAEKMREVQAVIGGEGNGGVIYPTLHYGRDALVGIALLLSYLARNPISASTLRATYPSYVMVKDKITLPPQTDLKSLWKKIQKHYHKYPINTEDGIKLMLPNGWVHLRQSNTEPIVRCYAEASTAAQANKLVTQVKRQLCEEA